jgi:hypothetical protein
LVVIENNICIFTTLMQQLQGKYISFLLLFLFVFPQIEKEIHSLKHSNDAHCLVKSEFHFHEKEHSCSLCDYTNNLSNSPEITSYKILLTTHSTSYQLYTTQVNLTQPDYQFPLRAPPAI